MLAKGKVFVSMEKLAEILSLPEGVEVIAVRPKGSIEEGFEFLVMSAEETVCTKKNVLMSQIRRTSVETLENFKTPKEERTGGIVSSGSIAIANIPFPEINLLGKGEVILPHEEAKRLFDSAEKIVENLSKKEKTIKDSFEDVLKMAQKKGNF